MSKHIKKNKKHKKSAIKKRKRHEKQACIENKFSLEKKAKDENRWRQNIY